MLLSEHATAVDQRRGTGARIGVIEQDHSLRSHDLSNPFCLHRQRSLMAITPVDVLEGLVRPPGPASLLPAAEPHPIPRRDDPELGHGEPPCLELVATMNDPLPPRCA